MAKRSTLLQSCSALVGDRQGNFGLMAALLLPVLLASGGVAIDVTNMMMAKNHLQDATDSAALAASSALANEAATQAQAKLMAMEFVKTQMQNWKSSGMSPEELTAFNEAFSKGTSIEIIEQKAALGNAKSYDVTVKSKFSLPLNGMTRLLGRDTAEVAAVSKSFGSAEAKNALSMFLVLDRSGSMAWKTNAIDSTKTSCNIYEESYWPNAKWKTPCYVSKIASLKLAVANLLTQLKVADPTSFYVRTAGVSYNDKQDSAGSLDWGTTKSLDYVNALAATGGTDSSGAFKAAVTALLKTGKNSEEKIHTAKNGQTAPKKYIVFMTDGENNYYQGRSDDKTSDAQTKESCREAKDNGIEVFAVAFMAPTRGQNLLKDCATDKSHYFQAEDSAALVAAFKTIGEKASELSVRLTQ
jgi:Flp pilus assembly protein TadG